MKKIIFILLVTFSLMSFTKYSEPEYRVKNGKIDYLYVDSSMYSTIEIINSEDFTISDAPTCDFYWRECVIYEGTKYCTPWYCGYNLPEVELEQ